MRFLVLVLAAALSACSTIAAECNKAAECGELGSRTADQCIADWEKKQADTETDPKCQNVVDKTLALWDCESGLSCEERQNSSSKACSSQQSDFNGALFAEPFCAFK